MNLLTSFTDEKVPTSDDSHKDSEIEFLDDDENNDWIGNTDDDDDHDNNYDDDDDDDNYNNNNSGEYQRGCDWEIYTTELSR
jgi:hypothetical protein